MRIQRDLGEFKLKINMGLGAFFGDQQVHGMYYTYVVYGFYNFKVIQIEIHTYVL